MSAYTVCLGVYARTHICAGVRLWYENDVSAECVSTKRH